MGAVEWGGWGGVCVRCKGDNTHNLTSVQPTGTDVLHCLIDLIGKISDAGDGPLGEIEGDLVCANQGALLLNQRRFGLHEDTAQVLGLQPLQLHTDGQAALTQ